MNYHTSRVSNETTLDLSGTYIRRTNLNGVNLTGADLSGADCSNATFRGANFTDALLHKTILNGADLTDATGLTLEQLSKAVTNRSTILPTYLRSA